MPNASPYNTGKQEERLEVARRCARENRYALIYANMVGGQDELVFDGASFALDAAGEPAALPDFTEGVNFVEVDAQGGVKPASAQADVAPYCLEEQVWNALVLGVRDYLGKNRFPAPSSACPAASIRPWCWPWRWTPSAPTMCAPS